ncbi:MAG: hypothetical protein NC418_05620 [Muribaculaceae bacterium]|nr:hypothetical protein [Muribaculaceae bacterium]
MSNSDKNTPDTLSDLRSGMEALRNNLSPASLIPDSALRQAMRVKSTWLNQFVVVEFILVPVLTIVFLALWHYTGISIWLAVTFFLAASVDTVLDLRTMAISKKWIQEETIVGLCQKLIRQKKERRNQTIISTTVMLPWVLWFTYEYMRHAVNYIPDESFALVCGITSVIGLATGLCVICVIYIKAQRTNDEMISRLKSFGEE